MSKKKEIQRIKDQIFQRLVLTQAKSLEIKKLSGEDKDNREQITETKTKRQSIVDELATFKTELGTWGVDADEYIRSVKDEVAKVIETDYVEDEE